MFGAQYYNQIVRKYIIGFGNLFNDIVVQRLNSAGVRVQSIGVPVAYGPKEKFLVRLAQDSSLEKEVMVQLPRMGFEITGMSYAGQRKLSSTIKNARYDTSDNNRLRTQFVPVPYDIQILLSIFVKNADDGTQILEQIVPYFRPEFTTNIKLVPSMNIVMDTPIVLNSVNIEDTYEGDFLTRRALIWNLDFTIQGYFFGPVSTTGVIKRTQVDFHANNIVGSSRNSRLVIVPGQLANGDVTSNSSVSVHRDTISANSDFGFAQNVFFFTDGFTYDPKTGSDSD
tara:strand:- start:403 stop:1251 length:849 start_codon:yes stop_codon:yes gene_type:complete